MRFGTCNVIRPNRAGSLRAVVEEISKYKLDSVEVHVRWNRGDTEPAGEHIFFNRKGNEYYELSTGVFIHKRIISTFKRVEFVSCT
jgi:hypothetical protein